MNAELQQIVAEAVQITGAEPPALVADDAPVLRDAEVDGSELYLVGLIGGKDVGKSALVNALAGQQITQPTGWGEGTAGVVAYAHRDQESAVRALLEAQVPGQYRVVAHDVEALRRQVLLDLPDIDSHWKQHVQITRRMLRHMLFPIWVQSVEKYADAAAQDLLVQVAGGNAPENFVFCLNKVDQVGASRAASATSDAHRAGDGSGGVVHTAQAETVAELEQLRSDYAARLARALQMEATPRVWMLSAIAPGRYELPELRAALTQQRSREDVQRARALAQRQQAASVLRWAQEQDLGGRLDRLKRLAAAAQEASGGRLGTVVLEEAVAGIQSDPAHRLAMIDRCMQKRVAHWPLVNIVHAVLWPVVTVLRRRLSISQQEGLRGAEALADMYLRGDGQDVATTVQATFAQLQQAHPLMSELYRGRKLWEPMVAEAAATDLRRRLARTIEQQREALVARFERRANNPALALWRALLTWGALLWFPLVQPVLEALLRDAQAHTVTHIGLLIVQVLGVTYLLKNATFLLLWFGGLWALLRWDTQRRVDRQFARWLSAGGREADLSLSATAVQWMDDLLEELRGATGRMQKLAEKLEAIAQELKRNAA